MLIRVRVNELGGAALVWSVCSCRGLEIHIVSDNSPEHTVRVFKAGEGLISYPDDDLMTLMERHDIGVNKASCLLPRIQPFPPIVPIEWVAHTEKFKVEGKNLDGYGPTPLIAVRRAYVMASIRDTDIFIPEKLLSNEFR